MYRKYQEKGERLNAGNLCFYSKKNIFHCLGDRGKWAKAERYGEAVRKKRGSNTRIH